MAAPVIEIRAASHGGLPWIVSIYDREVLVSTVT